MGCGPSTPAVLHAQQPPATTLLVDIVRTEPETTLTLPEYERSNGGTLPVTVDGKVVASIGGRTFKYFGSGGDWSKVKEKALAHVTPIKGADGKLSALIVPDGTMIPDGEGLSHVNGEGLFQTIYSAAPRVQGLAVAMEHDGVPLYPWATVKLVWRSGGWSGVSFPIDLATPGGYEPFGEIRVAVNIDQNVDAGTLKLLDGTPIGKYARAAGGATSYTAAAGVDAGLFVAAHVASVKNYRDGALYKG